MKGPLRWRLRVDDRTPDLTLGGMTGIELCAKRRAAHEVSRSRPFAPPSLRIKPNARPMLSTIVDSGARPR